MPSVDGHQIKFATVLTVHTIMNFLSYETLRDASPFFLMAGPNVIESEEHCMQLCAAIKAVADALGLLFVFKASFDKANRTSIKSFRGPGMGEGLKCAITVSILLYYILHTPHNQGVGRSQAPLWGAHHYRHS